MTNTPIADALALRAMASTFDAQRGKLPVVGDPHRSPEPIAVSRQISELGSLVTDLSDEVRFRTASEDPAPHVARTTTAFASAIAPTARAAASLGAVSHQLAFLGQTWPFRDRPDVRAVRESASLVIEDALAAADTELQDAATVLHAASTTIAPPSARLQAARRQTTIAVGKPHAPTPGASSTPAAATSPAAARGR